MRDATQQQRRWARTLETIASTLHDLSFAARVLHNISLGDSLKAMAEELDAIIIELRGVDAPEKVVMRTIRGSW
jgi:endonuclease YncB( thermonuclease family)